MNTTFHQRPYSFFQMLLSVSMLNKLPYTENDDFTDSNKPLNGTDVFDLVL